MKVPTLLAAVLVLASAQTTAPSEGHLVGCPNPATASEALAEIQRNDWRELSVERIQAIWRFPFDELKCESEKGFRMLVSKSRVINGHCECCEAFIFDVERNEGGASVESLHEIIIHYSATRRLNVVEAAKLLSHGAGMPKDKVATIARDSVQRFDWTDAGERNRQSYLAEVQFTKVGSNWSFILLSVPIRTRSGRVTAHLATTSLRLRCFSGLRHIRPKQLSGWLFGP
jgi:hypothetical protein